MTRPIVVTGAPGAGKTTLCANLALAAEATIVLPVGAAEASRTIDADKYAALGLSVAPSMDATSSNCIVETCAYGAEWRGEAGLLIVVIDGVTLAGKKAGLSAVDIEELALADAIALTRGDLVDVTQSMEVLAALTDVPILDVRYGKLDAADLPPENPRLIELSGRPSLTTWSYFGGARLDDTLAEKFLRKRPKGTLRIKGRAVATTTGLELDQSGRARSVTPCPVPEQSALFAAGAQDVFSEQEMNLHFAETAAAGAATAGWFGFR